MNIYEKLLNVMKEINYLQKDDTVAYKETRYKAISEEKVTSVVRESLIKNGIVVIPISQIHKREGTLTTVDVIYRIQNAEDKNDYIEAMSSGTGADTQDKGVGKAMTYAYKYLFLRLFAIPTGEDPDKISSAELDEKDREAWEKKINTPICIVCKKEIKDVKLKDGSVMKGLDFASRYGGKCPDCYRAATGRKAANVE